MHTQMRPWNEASFLYHLQASNGVACHVRMLNEMLILAQSLNLTFGAIFTLTWLTDNLYSAWRGQEEEDDKERLDSSYAETYPDTIWLITVT